MGHDHPVGVVDRLTELKPEERRAILGGTAARLLRIGA
jgi:hypothetical protein